MHRKRLRSDATHRCVRFIQWAWYSHNSRPSQQWDAVEWDLSYRQSCNPGTDDSRGLLLHATAFDDSSGEDKSCCFLRKWCTAPDLRDFCQNLQHAWGIPGWGPWGIFGDDATLTASCLTSHRPLGTGNNTLQPSEWRPLPYRGVITIDGLVGDWAASARIR